MQAARKLKIVRSQPKPVLKRKEEQLIPNSISIDRIREIIEQYLGDYIPTSEKGAANGVAPLNSNAWLNEEYLTRPIRGGRL